MKTNITIKDTKYYTDNKSVVTVCVIIAEIFGKTYTFRGKAKCSASDTMNPVIGKRVAESKAKAKMYKTASRIHTASYNFHKNKCDSFLAKADFCKYLADAELEHINVITK